MKTKPKAGSTSANPTALLLPLDADGFTRILETIAGETPDDYDSKETGRRIESAHRRAWCEVTEATAGSNPSAAEANLAEVSAQRKLTVILDDLMPAIRLRNQTVAAAAAQAGFLSYLREEAEPIENEVAALRARDARINTQGELANTNAMDDEIRLLQNYLDHGKWKSSSLDFREAEFEAGLGDLIREGKYTGAATTEAVAQRIEALNEQLDEAHSKRLNMLDAVEIARLKELESKLPAIREEITAAEDKAKAMEATAVAATGDLQVKIESAAIIARAIIQACRIQGGITTAAA